MITFLLLALVVSAQVYSSNETLQKKFNDYINRPEPVYSWFDEKKPFSTLMGNTVHKLNITSLQWLNDTVYHIDNGSSIWTHEVMVIVPQELKHKEHASLYLPALHIRCQSDYKPNASDIDGDLEIGDLIAQDTKMITIVAYHVPNCRMVFADDPHQSRMMED